MPPANKINVALRAQNCQKIGSERVNTAQSNAMKHEHASGGRHEDLSCTNVTSIVQTYYFLSCQRYEV